MTDPTAPSTAPSAAPSAAPSTAGTVYSRRPDLRAVEMNGELVMMGQDQGEYYGLKDVAASLWHHLAEPRTLDQLCTLVAAEYDVTAEACRADIERFLTQLVAKDLVRVG